MKCLAKCVVSAMVVLAAVGCASKPAAPPPPRPKTLRVTHHVGGTHHKIVVHANTWYQTFGSNLIIIEPPSAEVIRSIELGKLGESGPAIDLIYVDAASSNASYDRLLAVIKDDEVIELSVENPRLPVITRRISDEMLGVKPRVLSFINGQVYVSGRGGVVRLSDFAKLLESDQIVGRVAMSDHGLVACIGRGVHRLQNSQFVGSATGLWTLPKSFGIPGGLVFALQNEKAALVGLMSSEVRELDAGKLTVAVPGVVYNVRFIDDLIWVVSDGGIRAYKFENSELKTIVYSDVLGARDVGPVRPNYLAASGSIGRALFRIATDEEGPGDTFFEIHREAGYLPVASSDGRYILAGSAQGMWLYLVNSRVEQTEQTRDRWPPSPQSAATVGTTATIASDSLSVNISAGDRTWTHSEPGGHAIRCIMAVDGQYWLGHDRGITVLKPDGGVGEALAVNRRRPPPPNPVAGRVRIEGPVLHIYPMLIGGGASFVSEYGGMGVAQFVE